jgi:long-chain acyl-CoA synthetase
LEESAVATLVTRAEAQSSATVAVRDDLGTELSWSDLDRRVNRWVHLLRAGGLATGDRVCVLAGNRAQTVEVLLACLHTGLTAVPVNWHLTPAEVGYLIVDSGSRGLVVDPERAGVAATALAEHAGQPGAVPFVVAFGDHPAHGIAAVEPLLAAVVDTEPADQVSGATMLYTSGTTGHPKGVVNGLMVAGAPLDRISATVQRLRAAIGLPTDGRLLLVGPWYHSAQMFFALFPLLLGGQLVTRSRFDPVDTLRSIDGFGITHCHLVPTQFIRLLRVSTQARRDFDGLSLRTVWHGGGPCAVEVKYRMIQWWGPVFTEYYAATEGGIATLIDSDEWLAHPGSVGHALPSTGLVVVGEDGAELPPGEEGRVFLRRPPTASFHYHNAPEKTLAAHLAPGTFTYGDVGHLDADGYLFLTGRGSETIVSGGVNIYPAEIEAVLHVHPGVRDAVVFGVPDDEFGERVKAVVALEPQLASAQDVAAELDAHCRAHLAGFKVPRVYQVVATLPRDTSGKLRRQALHEQESTMARRG